MQRQTAMDEWQKLEGELNSIAQVKHNNIKKCINR